MSFRHITSKASRVLGTPQPMAECSVVPLMWVAAMPVAAVTATQAPKSSPKVWRSRAMICRPGVSEGRRTWVSVGGAGVAARAGGRAGGPPSRSAHLAHHEGLAGARIAGEEDVVPWGRERARVNLSALETWAELSRGSPLTCLHRLHDGELLSAQRRGRHVPGPRTLQERGAISGGSPGRAGAGTPSLARTPALAPLAREPGATVSET